MTNGMGKHHAEHDDSSEQNDRKQEQEAQAVGSSKDMKPEVAKGPAGASNG